MRVCSKRLNRLLHPTSVHSLILIHFFLHVGLCLTLHLGMENFRLFQSILQSSVEPDQDSWNYVCVNLPRPQQANSSGFIKHVSISATETKQHIVLRYERSPNNRITRTEPLDKLLLLSFADLRLRWPGLEPSDPSRPATTKEHGDYITRILIGGIKLNNVQYNFFGHSNSQLKSRSCFMYAASKAEIASKIEAMGNFTQLKSVAKKAKRIGLLFSSADIALVLSPERCEDIDDIERDSHVFTDGCGLIALQLARQLAQRRNIVFRDKRYLPSVFQIRYRGYKGVLTVDNTLQGQVQVQFRNSMRKFKDASDHSFAVVDYSKVRHIASAMQLLTSYSRMLLEISTMKLLCSYIPWALEQMFS
jgi:hypothetical protein